MRKRRSTCVVTNCPTNCLPEAERGQFFCFPRGDSKRDEWVMKLKREDLLGRSVHYMSSFVVCKLHFSDHHFRTPDHSKLNTNVSPNEVGRNVVCENEVHSSCNEDLPQLRLPLSAVPLPHASTSVYPQPLLPVLAVPFLLDDNVELHTVELPNACEAEDLPAAPEDPSEDPLLIQDSGQQPTQHQITCNKQATIDPTQLCAVVSLNKRPANKIATVLNVNNPPVQVVQEECVEPESKRACLEEPNVSTDAEYYLQNHHISKLTKLRVAKVTNIKIIKLIKD